MICSAGRGFITVDTLGKPLLYDGSRPLDLSSTRAVSVFHQLHCLVSFAISLSTGMLLRISPADLLRISCAKAIMLRSMKVSTPITTLGPI